MPGILKFSHAPQLKHSHSRIDKSNLPLLNPQQEQILDVGSQRLITLKS
ncbi:MAG: hypothetical protein O4965_01275 [Trichodesmium sp. St19_bin1]|nr:hypothetical protein [Trichodesmium sp. St19_bin1]